LAADLSHSPVVLYHASVERRNAACEALRCGDYVLSIYLAGLAVECLVQAIARLDDPTYDARHDLAIWLSRCRTSLQDKLNSKVIREHSHCS
jgi:hypothetical protein